MKHLFRGGDVLACSAAENNPRWNTDDLVMILNFI